MEKNDIEKIFEIGESFFSASEAKDLLGSILDGARKTCTAERATLFLSETHGSAKSEFLKSYAATDLCEEIQEIEVPAGIGIVGYTYKTLESQVVNDVSSCPHFNPEIDQITKFHTRSILSVPLIDHTRQAIGVIQVLNKASGDFNQEDLKMLKLLSLLSYTALRRVEEKRELKKMKNRISDLNQSRVQNVVWETQLPELKELYGKIQVVSGSQSSVLLTGESGTGKEVMARKIHGQSEFADGPFVAVNCAAIPENLFEAELFGIKKGTATGVDGREGLFEKANGGTLFFDEIGEMPFDMQSKLLRALQERVITPVGASKEVPFHCRIISATNRDLLAMTKVDNGFREDLYFRINVFEFRLPALRDRADDLRPLSTQLVASICSEQNFSSKSLSPEALDKLHTYTWPGNIRELKNVLERACVLSQSNPLISGAEILLPLSEKTSIPVIERASTDEFSRLLSENADMNQATKLFQKAYANKVITTCEGNKTQAAKVLSLSREGLRKILKRPAA